MALEIALEVDLKVNLEVFLDEAMIHCDQCLCDSMLMFYLSLNRCILLLMHVHQVEVRQTKLH